MHLEAATGVPGREDEDTAVLDVVLPVGGCALAHPPLDLYGSLAGLGSVVPELDGEADRVAGVLRYAPLGRGH